ncbi:MAG: ESPR-type extended signal peptide-containing protein, partial [Succiniclasticum sp.]|uniref:ESPR-type extended signal peptide-containing protein n=1 Tax=Succiniclasticum sp. TaxID=2775030 RepID=UPI002A91465D
MNRIYKVIWSKTKHCYVVVSELAKRHTKGGSTGGCRMMTARVLSTLLLGAYLVGGYSMPSAWAADIEADKITAGSITVGEVQVGSFLSILEDAGTGYSMAIGEGSNANAGNSVAILGGVTEAGATNSLAIGEGSVTNAANSVAMLGGTTSEGATNALAIGRGAQATLSDSIALGSGAVADRAKYDGTDNPYKAYLNEDDTKTNSAWRATHNAIAVGASEIDSNTATVTATVTRQLTGLAAGTEDTDAVNVAQLKAATVDLVNIQGITRDNNKTTIEQGFTVQTNFNSGSSNGYMNVNWGQGTLANGENATAWGKSTVARSPRSTAWGNEAKAKGDQATAFGSRTTAYGVNSTAWGADTVAFSHQATAFGEN